MEDMTTKYLESFVLRLLMHKKTQGKLNNKLLRLEDLNSEKEFQWALLIIQWMKLTT